MTSRRLTRYLAAPAMASAALLVLAGCASGGSSSSGSGQPDAAAEIVIGSQNEPTNLDQIFGGSSGVTEVFTGNVYEGLFRITDDAEVEPLLAAETEVSDDGLVYTFTLADAAFHSGDPLTADDVKYSLERFVGEDSIAARKNQLKVIDTVEVVDDTTVAVTLSQPSISFTYNLGYVWIVNDEAGELTTSADGTGPYALADYRKGDSITLEVNDDYWGDAPANGGVVYQYYADPTALNNALLTGAVDLVTSQSNPDSLAEFESAGFQIIEGTSTTKELLGLNTRIAPFNDAAVRKALYSAIDREKLLDAIWDGRGELIGSMVPPSEPWYLDLADNNPYDPALAEQLLADAGYADGFTFTIDTPDSGVHSTVAEFLKSELAKVGVTVEINIITDDEWYQKVYTDKNFEATLQGHVNDRDINFYGNPDFYWGYDNADVQTWLAQSEAASTVEEQTELIAKANQQISDDAASVWLYLNPQLRIAAEGVSGVPENGLNSLFYVYDITKA
ncbi:MULTISPECIES: ABC transporter substrate-binding protein [unclassified Microbacterium]|uniref:ABC transporter substrate-binding protein n=1 Tax=unclassified Microbacterium TaxID=2609290 RepID=UPI00214AB78A|nr:MULTISPECIES: ABC transporter substrate-binding protein [unclassified Microbacterium]MCR2799277.1 ABC transporter substrate-binding protein [Microbacterium sp. zg.Y818]MCR2824137.1 ABC transporter substrate-binding protein [Microbacterium sp. zg.Y909]WIM21280.1 ABC transporter substrate-binding protein [Microbacterium sp. zg-Y818]